MRDSASCEDLGSLDFACVIENTNVDAAALVDSGAHQREWMLFTTHSTLVPVKGVVSFELTGTTEGVTAAEAEAMEPLQKARSGTGLRRYRERAQVKAR